MGTVFSSSEDEDELEQEPEMPPFQHSSSPLSPQISMSRSPFFGPSMRNSDPYYAITPVSLSPTNPPGSHLSRFHNVGTANSPGPFLPSWVLAAEEIHTEVYLIRHAQSTANLRPELITGRSPTAILTETGRQEAKALGLFLRSTGAVFDAVYSSPLERARQTAVSVCQRLPASRPACSHSHNAPSWSTGSGRESSILPRNILLAPQRKGLLDPLVPTTQTAGSVAGLRSVANNESISASVVDCPPHSSKSLQTFASGCESFDLKGLQLDWKWQCQALTKKNCTALSIPEEHVEVLDALQELSQGQWEGRARSEVYTKEVLQLMNNTQPDFRAPGGESQRQVEFRMVEFLNNTVLPHAAIALQEEAKLDKGKGSVHTNMAMQIHPMEELEITSSPEPKHLESIKTTGNDAKHLERVPDAKHLGHNSNSNGDDSQTPEDGLQEDDAHRPEHRLQKNNLTRILIRREPESLQKRSAYSVAVFTHGIAIKCALRGLLGSDPHRTQQIYIDNSSVSVLKHASSTGWQVHRCKTIKWLQSPLENFLDSLHGISEILVDDFNNRQEETKPGSSGKYAVLQPRAEIEECQLKGGFGVDGPERREAHVKIWNLVWEINAKVHKFFLNIVM